MGYKKLGILALLSAIVFLDSFSYFVAIPIILELFHNNTLIGTSLHINTYISITVSISTFTALICAPIAGFMSDKLGSRRVIIFGLIFMCVSFLLPIVGIIKRNLWIIWLSRIISGIGSTTQPVAQASMCSMTSGNEKTYALGLIATTMTMAIVIGPLVGGYLSANFLSNYLYIAIPYVVSFILTLVVLVLALLFFKNVSNNQSIAAVNKHINYNKKIIIALTLVFFLLEFSWSQYYQSVFFYLTDIFHYLPQKISLFNSYVGITRSIGLVLVYPFIIKLFKLPNVLNASVSTLSLSFIIYILLPNKCIVWIMAGIIAFAAGIGYTSIVAMISNNTNDGNQGRAMGILSTLLYSAWAITGVIGGSLFDIYKFLPFYISLVSIVIALGICAYVTLGKLE